MKCHFSDSLPAPLYTLNFVGVQMSTGLMSVNNCAPQMMNMRLPLSASTGQRPGSRNIPLNSLISAFIFPDDCSEQSPGCMHVLHVQQNMNPPRGCLAGTDATNNCMNPTGQFGCKSTRRKNIPHFIRRSGPQFQQHVCLHAVSLLNYQRGGRQSNALFFLWNMQRKWWLIWILP